MEKRNVVIFGVGKFYQNRKDVILSKEFDIKIIAFLDNNSELWGKQIDDIYIYSPDEVVKLQFDVLLLMSVSAHIMKQQVLKLGVPEGKIWTWEIFCADIMAGRFRLYGRKYIRSKGRKCLLVTTYVDYNGGTQAIIYAAKALQRNGYCAVIATPGGNEKFIEEAIEDDITIVKCPALCFPHEEELAWIKQFDCVIVNTFQMVLCAQEISGVCPVLWWLHESSAKHDIIYGVVREQLNFFINSEKFANINIQAVSNIAKENFDFYYPNLIDKTLRLGIPDEQNVKRDSLDKENKIVFAIIGSVCELKAQKVFVEAVGLLDAKDISNCEFWLIGSVGTDSYCQDVFNLANSEPSIRICGQMNRKEIMEAYSEIDVVVCPSLEETMSIVVVEGMMLGKICVTSDRTGVSEYVEDGTNGFICQAGNSYNLFNVMKTIIYKFEELDEMRISARNTYEKYFSMEVFADNLEKALEETMQNHHEC